MTVYLALEFLITGVNGLVKPSVITISHSIILVQHDLKPIYLQTQKTVPLDANLVAGDYAIAISYNGSDDYAPSEGNGTLRVKAEIGWNITVSQNWTHLGDSVWINGSIYDAVFQSPILGDNVSQYSMVLISDDGRNIDLAQGLLTILLQHSQRISPSQRYCPPMGMILK